jgi:hypothetical protein
MYASMHSWLMQAICCTIVYAVLADCKLPARIKQLRILEPQAMIMHRK